MSLFDDASLVLIPDGAKDGTLYSVKPTDGTGDFTFSRGSNLAATRVDENGLIEKGRENLVLQSNQFDTTWSLFGGTLTSGQSGYDGSSDAWLFNKTGSAILIQNIVVSGVHTASVYVKSGTLNWFLFLITSASGDRGVYFDLSTGNYGSQLGSSKIDIKTEDVGGGWYRFSFTDNINTSSTIRIYPANGNSDLSGTGTIYIQDAQLEVGLVATDYIETGATTAQAGILEDLPRIDYSGGASCPALLLEPQRTNLYTNSEYSGIWVKTSWTTTDNYAISPEGVKNAFRAVSSNTSGILYLSGTGTTGQDNTLSVWAKSNTGGEQKFRFWGNGNTITSSDFTATTEWQRFDYTYNCTFVTAGIKGASSELSDILFYGFQHEAGSYPTSYIPTYGSSVTRSADSCVKTGISSLIGQTEGTFYVDFEYLDGQSTANENWFALESDDGNQRILWYKGSTLRQRFLLQANGTSVFSNSSLIDPLVAGTRYKMAVRYNSGDIAIYINGSQIATDTSTYTMSTNLNEVTFNESLQSLSSRFNQMLVFAEGLSNADLTTLTTL